MRGRFLSCAALVLMWALVFSSILDRCVIACETAQPATTHQSPACHGARDGRASVSQAPARCRDRHEPVLERARLESFDPGLTHLAAPDVLFLRESTLAFSIEPQLRRYIHRIPLPLRI